MVKRAALKVPPELKAVLPAQQHSLFKQLFHYHSNQHNNTFTPKNKYLNICRYVNQDKWSEELVVAPV